MISDTNISLIINILSGSATSEEKQSFEEWLKRSEDNRQYYKNIRILWEHSDKVFDRMDFDKEAAKEMIRSKIRDSGKLHRTIKKRTIIRAAASIVVLFGLAAAAVLYSVSTVNRTIRYTSADQVREIILPDSSHIWLNENSTLIAPKRFKSGYRKVTLEGEAYFEISHDDSKPFKVRAGKTFIKVLGTKFDVKMEKEIGDVCVIVKSGKVAFWPSGNRSDQAILTQGKKGQYSGSEMKVSISGNADRNYLSWKTGTLDFYDTPLNEVCKILSEYYKTSVTTHLIDSNLFLTGCFQNESLDDILKTIELTFDLKTSVSKDGVMIHNQMKK